MEISNELIIAIVTALAASPVLAGWAARSPVKKTNVKLDDLLLEIEKVSKSFLSYKIEQALQDFSSKTIRITEGNSLGVTIEEWHYAKNALSILLPEEEWPATLQEEVKIAREIIRRGELNG